MSLAYAVSVARKGGVDSRITAPLFRLALSLR